MQQRAVALAAFSVEAGEVGSQSSAPVRGQDQGAAVPAGRSERALRGAAAKQAARRSCSTARPCSAASAVRALDAGELGIVVFGDWVIWSAPHGGPELGVRGDGGVATAGQVRGPRRAAEARLEGRSGRPGSPRRA